MEFVYEEPDGVPTSDVDNPSPSCSTPIEMREEFIQRRLERFFTEIGLSRFSGKIATGYFQTQLQKPGG